jgi:tetratricopeptide (TPR) repeat protein
MNLHFCSLHGLRVLLCLGVYAGSGTALAAVTPASGAAPQPPYRAPYIPADDAELLQEVPSTADPSVRQMHLLRGKLDADARDLQVAQELSQTYIDFGRQIGDAHYVGYAEAVLGPWLAQASPPAGVLVQYATILQYRHQFADARGQLKKALLADAHSTQAWLTLANLDMVQGEYDTAARECSQVAANNGYVLAIACAGNLRSYVGAAEQSLALLKQVDRGSQALPPPLSAWIQGLLAETSERLGDWTGAETYYRKALALTPNDNFLLVAYADLLLDRNRPGDVLTLLRDYAQSDTAFLRLALAKAALHSPDAPLYTWIMGARFAALAQRGSDYFGREQVRFALYLQHDPQTALRMAERNWQVQRAPWDVRVLLESALAAGKPAAAGPVLAFLHHTKLQDPIIEPLAHRTETALARQGASP